MSMNILFKMNENTIRAIDLSEHSLVFDITMKPLEMRKDMYDSSVSAVAVTLCVNPSTYSDDDFKNEIPIYGCLVPITKPKDYVLVVDFLGFIAKKLTSSVYEGIFNQKFTFNLDGVSNNLMQSSVTPVDAPVLDKWHDVYEKVVRIIKEYGYYSINEFCENATRDVEQETFDDIYNIFNPPTQNRKIELTPKEETSPEPQPSVLPKEK